MLIQTAKYYDTIVLVPFFPIKRKESKSKRVSSLTHLKPIKRLHYISSHDPLPSPPSLLSYLTITTLHFKITALFFSTHLSQLITFFLTKITPTTNPILTSNSLTSLRHHHHQSLFSGARPLSSDSSAATAPSLFLKFPSPTTTPPSITTSTSTANTAVFSLSSATSSSSSTAAASTSGPVSLDVLRQHLEAQDFRKADEETRRLLIVLAGEHAQKRGYVFFSEVQFISSADLKAVDDLWLEHSNNRFGYSVQRKVWIKKSKRNFTELFMKLGWMKKLETEVEQYNYRAFPEEFTWELNGETPEGHLPLTNALRGTQLFNSILCHPAFEAEEEEEEEEEEAEELKRNDGSVLPLTKRVFKTDYSF